MKNKKTDSNYVTSTVSVKVKINDRNKENKTKDFKQLKDWMYPFF
jgi:hypothetical protein